MGKQKRRRLRLTYIVKLVPAILITALGAQAADPHAAWEQAVQAKGGRDRLHRVHALAVYMKPAEVVMAGPYANWLCVFPNRYFEYDGPDSGGYPYMGANGFGIASSPRAIVVDMAAGRIAMDATGTPRTAWHPSAFERDRLVLNQLIFLLESAWLQPRLIEMRHNVLVVEAGGRTYRLTFNRDDLPKRIFSPPIPKLKPKVQYDYKLERYRDFDGIMLPTRIESSGNVRAGTWDVDYEVDARYNPKLFERMPDLANGPEPWRMK